MFIKIEDHILYEDKDLIVCHKSAGIAVQNARIGSMDLESALKNYLALKNPGKMPYLGIIHRLDQPVEGILVFAKHLKAAAELSRQMSAGEMRKTYLAVTAGEPKAESATLEDYLKKDGKTNTSKVVKKGEKDAKKALLHYEVKAKKNGKTLLEIRLETGRHHQIRVQMAHAGLPLLGDRKYNPQDETKVPLALCSAGLILRHPGTKKVMEFTTTPCGEAFVEFFDAKAKRLKS